MPSGVLIVTSVSETGMAAEAEPVAATMPAATDMAMKPRRETSLFVSFCFSETCLSSSIIGSLLFVNGYSGTLEILMPDSQNHKLTGLLCQRFASGAEGVDGNRKRVAERFCFLAATPSKLPGDFDVRAALGQRRIDALQKIVE